MFFTREDILKIQQALLQLGVKDSELPSVESVTYDDILSIVQDGKNKQISIKDFFNQLSLWRREDFINITDRYDEPYISLREAINLVPILQRKDGLVITFQDIEGNWRIYQFRGNITEFLNEEKWFDLYDYRNYIVKSIVPDEEDLTASTPDKNGNSFASLKDRIYDPIIFSGKGYKFVRKNIINVKLAVTKINVTNPTTLEGDIDFHINNKSIKVHLSPTIHNTTKLVSEAIKEALVIAYNDYEVTVANSVITLTHKYSGNVSPTTFEMYNTGVKVIVEDSIIIDERNIITQDNINKTDTIYEIRYDFDLDGKTITIPKNCILYFTSGKFYNGSINMDNTIVSTLYEDVLSEVNINGNYYNIQKNIKDANNLIQGNTNKLNNAEKNIKRLDTRSSQMEESIKAIAATGGASVASAVSYDNSISKLESITIQGAVDEVSSIGHFAKRGGIVNISTNYNSTNVVEVLTLSQAINKVPLSERLLGFSGTFLTVSGWKTYKFTGDSISDWSDTFNWKQEEYSENNNSVIYFTNPDNMISSLVKELYISGDTQKYLDIRATSIKRNYKGLWQFTIRGNLNGVVITLGNFSSVNSSFENLGVQSVTNYNNTGVNIFVLLDWNNIEEGTNLEYTSGFKVNNLAYNLDYSPTIKSEYKVDKVKGKQLSTNDFTNDDKNKLQRLKEFTNSFLPGLNTENKIAKAIVALNIDKGDYEGDIFVGRMYYKFASGNSIATGIQFCETSLIDFNKILASYDTRYAKDDIPVEPVSNIKIKGKYNIVIDIIIDWSVFKAEDYILLKGDNKVGDLSYNKTFNPSLAILPVIEKVEQESLSKIAKLNDKISRIEDINTIRFTNSIFGNQVIKELYIEDRKGHDKIILVDVKRAYYINSINSYSWQLSLNYEDSNGNTGRFGSFIVTGKTQDFYDEPSYVKFNILNEDSKIYALVDWSAIAIGSQDFNKKEVNNYAFDLNYSPSISLILEKNKADNVISDLSMIKDRFLSFSMDKEEEITSLIVNKNSTQKTKNLFWNLKKNAYNYKIIFGQHRTNETGVSEEGISWDLRSGNNFSKLVGDKYIVNNIDSIEWKSDIHRVSGYKPFLLSDDLGYSVGEYYSNVKKKNAADIIGACKKFYKETGGIITFSFHFQNPWYSYEEGATGEPYRYKSENHPYVLRELTDNTTILHDDVTVTKWFDGLLDEWANIINNITDEKGNLIPVIIRPFHEGSNSAFWWGHSYGTPEEYKNAFIYFVNKIISKCNNVLIAYSPDKNWSSMREDDLYMDRYPGDDYVDIMGYDDYDIGTSSIDDSINRAKLLTYEAEVRKKIPALTETGNNSLNISKWFNDHLYKVLNNYEVRFAYSLVWNNSSTSMYYTPFQSSGESTEDFKKFMSRKDIVKSESNINYYSNITE